MELKNLGSYNEILADSIVSTVLCDVCFVSISIYSYNRQSNPAQQLAIFTAWACGEY